MDVWEPTMYRTGKSFFKGMGAWAPTTFSEGGCGKSLFENQGCQRSQNIGTVSFLTMYSEG